MDHTALFLMELNEEVLVCLLLDYQGKFNSILDDINNTLTNLRLYSLI